MECNYYQVPKILGHLTPSETVVFIIMYDQWRLMKNEDGWYYRSQTSLSEDCGLSPKTVQRCVKSLVEKNILQIKRHNDGKVNAEYDKANDYRFIMEEIIQLSKKGTSDNTFESECESQDTEKGTSDNTFKDKKVVKLTTFNPICESQDTEKVVKITTFNDENSKEGGQNDHKKVDKFTIEGGQNDLPYNNKKNKKENNNNTSATVYSALENKNLNELETMENVYLEIDGLIDEIGNYMNNLNGGAGDIYWGCIVKDFNRLKELLPQDKYAEVRHIFKEQLKVDNIDISKFTSNGK